MVLETVSILLAGLVILWFAGDRSVRYSVELSDYLGISSFTLGFLLISVSTGLPEIVTVMVSSISGVPELSAGNLVGASLVNLTLILGASAVIAGSLPVDRSTEDTLIKILAVITLLVSAVLLVSRLTVWHGILLLATYAGSMYYLGRTGIAEKIVKEEAKEARAELEEEMFGYGPYGTLFKLSVALALLVIGAHFTVNSSITLGSTFGIPLEVLGATVVAVGTALPELSLGLNAVKRREYELALGDVFGSALVNLTLILGVLSVVNPTRIATIPLTGTIFFMFVALGFIWFRLIRNHQLDTREGWILIVLFALYILEEYGVTGLFPGLV